MSVDRCLFCQIAAGAIPATIVGENAHALAFRDLHPQAPLHVLVIPRVHAASLADPLPPEVMAGTIALVREVAAAEGIAASGYRVVTNVGGDGGQTVSHLHFHLLGGRAMHWPPG